MLTLCPHLLLCFTINLSASPFPMIIIVTFYLTSRCLTVIFLTSPLSLLHNFFFFTSQHPLRHIFPYFTTSFMSQLPLHRIFLYVAASFTSRLALLFATHSFTSWCTLFFVVLIFLPTLIGVDGLCVRCLFQLHWTFAHLLQLILGQVGGRDVPINF